MPSHTVKQAKVMSAISHGWHPSKGSVAKIPVKVAKEFHAADAGHKYGKGMHHSKKQKALNTAKKYAEGGGTGKSTNFRDFRRSDNIEDRRKEKGEAKFAERPTPPSAYAETAEISPLSWQLGMGAIASGHALDPLIGQDYADGGSVDDDPKEQAISIHPVDPNAGLYADLNKKSPLEGAAPANPSLTAHQDTPRETITNWLAGPDTKSYEPRSVLANKAMNVLDFTPPMMAEQAGEDVAKGHLQDAAMFMMPGAKKAKSALYPLEKAIEAAANYSVKDEGATIGQQYIAKSLKAQYPKDLATKAIENGYTQEQIGNIKTYMSPGAQTAFDKHYTKMAPKKEPTFEPNFIQDYHTNQGVDYDKLLAEIESHLQPQKPPGPFEVPMETYDQLHAKLSQQPLGLNDEQKSAVAYWGDPSGYKAINGYLRGQKGSAVNDMQANGAIQALDSAMAPLGEPTSVWRGLHGPHAEELKKLGVGDTFWNAGYTATSIDPRRATHYGAKDGPGIILNYHLPEGHPALYTSHPDAGGWSQAEREMLVPHNAPFKIVGTEKMKAPVWDYTGNVKNAEPQDFVVYHVAPADKASINDHQLDNVHGAASIYGPKTAAEQFKPKGKDTDIEDYYAHQEKHQTGPEWEPDEEDTPHNVTDIHKNAPYLKMQAGELSIPEYKQALRSHIKPSNWMEYRPKDVKPEELPAINWGKNNPEHLQSIGVNTNTHLFKGGMWDNWGNDPFVPGGYPKEVMDPNKKHSEQAFHMASKPGIAEAYHGYSKDIGGSYVAWKPKFAEFDWPSFFGSNHYASGDLDAVSKEAKKMGLDMVAVHNMHDSGSHLHGLHTQYLVLNTNVLRAPHAAFDPQKWHLRYPLAGLAGGGMFTYGALRGEGDNQFAHGGRVEAEKALPANHQLGMKVPKGGSMCANCKFLASPTTCGNKGFIEWNGKPELPAPSDQYCCDLYGHNKPEHKAEGGAAFGTLSPAEEAERPPSPVVGAIDNLATLPQRAIEASAEDMEHLGEPGYEKQSIGPAVETAMNMVGGAGIVPAEANSLRTGAGIFANKRADQVWQQYRDLTDYMDQRLQTDFNLRKGSLYRPHGQKILREQYPEEHAEIQRLWGLHGKLTGYAKGGKVAKKQEDPKDHEFQDFSGGGLIDSSVPGRTDKHPMKVQPGSYVLPADIPSALGQGNTKAGSEVLNKMFTHAAYGLKPMTQKAQKFHFDSFPSIGTRTRADGGRTNSEHIPIVAAGGEYIIHPDVVKEVGNGDMSKGHSVLDKFVLHTRAQHIKTLKGLKGPKK